MVNGLSFQELRLFVSRLAFVVVGLVGVMPGAGMAHAESSESEQVLREAHRTIVERYRESLLETRRVRQSTAIYLARQLNDEGYWPNLNYEDDRRAAWSPERHVTNLRSMATVVYRDDDTPAEVLEAIERGLRWWLDADPQAPNWWFNEIGVPGNLMGMLVMVGDDLPDDLRDRAIRALDRAQIRYRSHSGQNAISTTRIVLIRSALSHDDAKIREAVERIGQGITMSTTAGEGIQPDFSFHAHGPQLYNGGYGSEFAHNTAELAYLLHDTPYALNDEKVALLCDYLLEGQQWMMRESLMSYSAGGRGGFSRARGGRRQYIEAALQLAQIYPDRAEELQLFIDRQRGEAPPVEGYRHFWRSDFSVQHSDDHLFTVKAYSSRIRPNGAGNGENLKGTHLDHGLTLLIQHGNEYDGLFPVWDWKFLPGTTTVHDGRLPIRDWAGPLGETDFVGGAGHGKHGLKAFDFRFSTSDDTPPLEARKAWFIFDGAIVALGAGVHGGGAYDVTTTLNQSYLRGPVVVGGADDRQQFDSPAAPTRDLSQMSWVQHDNIGYVVLDADHGLHLRAGSQEGAWRDINRDSSGRRISHDVFRLWISHGEAPTEGAYGYVLLPAADAAATAAFAAQPPIHVLANTASRQAVYHADQRVLQIAFYEAGEFAVDEMDSPWSTVTVDKPCLVMLEAGDSPALTIADPTHKLEQIVVTVDGRERMIDLPRGGYAGQSVRVALQP